MAAYHHWGANDIVVWDLIDGSRRTCPAPSPNRRIMTLAVSPDGKLIATGDQGAKIEIHDAVTLERRFNLISHRDGIVCLAFSPDCRRLASGDLSGSVKLWDVAAGEELLELDGLEGAPALLQFAPDGMSLVAATWGHGGRFVTWRGRAHRSEPPGETH